MNDSDLKKDHIYWGMVEDKDCLTFGDYVTVKYNGFRFINVEDTADSYYVGQIRIQKEVEKIEE